MRYQFGVKIAALTIACLFTGVAKAASDSAPDVQALDPNALVGTLVSAPGPACAPPEALQTAGHDITNFHWLPDESVFRGGQPNSKGMQDLARLNVDMVIDLEGGDIRGKNVAFDAFNYLAEPGERPQDIREEIDLGRRNGIQVVSLPLNANDRVKKKEAKTIDEILDLLHSRSDKRTYIHCEHGKDRTGLIMALYAVKYLHQSPEKAHAEMVADGHRGLLDHLFTKQMDRYFWKVAPTYVK